MESDVREFLELSHNFSTAEEFLNDDKVNSIIKRWSDPKLDTTHYCVIVKGLINSSGFTGKSAKLLNNLFTPNSLTISAYRKYLRYLGQISWNDHRDNNGSLYSNLSYRIIEYLNRYSLEDAIKHFDKEIDAICSVTNKSRAYMEDLFERYKNAILIGDRISSSSISSDVKNVVRSFNSKARERYINSYIDEHLTDIKGCFEQKRISKKNKKVIPPYVFSSTILSDHVLRNQIYKFIKKHYSLYVDTNEMRQIIVNMLDEQDSKNYELFNLECSPNMMLLKSSISYNRLVKNFLGSINNSFDIEQCSLINAYLKETDIVKRRNMRVHFKKNQISLLERILPILKEATGRFVVKDEKFILESDVKVLDLFELREAKNELVKFKYYEQLKNSISKIYYKQCRAMSDLSNSSGFEDVDELPFTDDNYFLINTDYFNNFEIIKEILPKLDKAKIEQFSNNNSPYMKLRKLFVDEGFATCFLFDDKFNSDIVANIINNAASISTGSLNNDFSMNRLSDIIKRSFLYEFIDDFTLAILGEEVAEKIVYNSQFLQEKNTPSAIRTRLNKAVDLMIEAEKREKSAIPYFDDVSHGMVRLSRYKNNDPAILTSGIDSGTCFKISANNNDYLFYSVVNKNGLVIRAFDDQGNLCGRITGHTLCNVLMINGIRVIGNEYQPSSYEKLQRNNHIIEALKILSNELIEMTTDSNCPIDFVVSNKSGILEAAEYNDLLQLVDEKLFENPFDTYDDDFKEFAELFREKDYLQEVPYYCGGRQAPFTTDFGHYPIGLIASRDNMSLDTLRDIAYIGPDAVYDRPEEEEIIGTGVLSGEALRRVRKIDALSYINDGGKPEEFNLKDYNGIMYKSYKISGNDYLLVDYNDNLYCNSSVSDNDVKQYVKID